MKQLIFGLHLRYPDAQSRSLKDKEGNETLPYRNLSRPLPPLKTDEKDRAPKSRFQDFIGSLLCISRIPHSIFVNIELIIGTKLF